MHPRIVRESAGLRERKGIGLAQYVIRTLRCMNTIRDLGISKEVIVQVDDWHRNSLQMPF
jgi:hypothetical protein